MKKLKFDLNKALKLHLRLFKIHIFLNFFPKLILRIFENPRGLPNLPKNGWKRGQKFYGLGADHPFLAIFKDLKIWELSGNFFLQIWELFFSEVWQPWRSSQ